MRRVIGMDIHRTFAEVVFWEEGRLRHHGRVDMTRSGLEGFGRSLEGDEEVVVEATGNAMSVVRVLSPFVARMVVANPMQVKAVAHARVKTDKIDAGVLAQLQASGFLPEVWVPDDRTERLRRLVARRNQVVRHRTRVKNEVHGILQAHLVPKCPHADLFNKRGRDWLSKQALPDDERAAIARHVREVDRLAEDLADLDGEIAKDTVDDADVQRLLTIAGVNAVVAAGIVAAIGDISRIQRTAEARQLLRPQPAGSAVRPRPRPVWPDQQTREITCSGPAGGGSLGGLESARSAAGVLPADPQSARSSSCCRRDRAQTCGSDLAPPDQEAGLSLAAPFARRGQTSATRAEGRRAVRKGKGTARLGLRLQSQAPQNPRTGGLGTGRESLRAYGAALAHTGAEAERAHGRHS